MTDYRRSLVSSHRVPMVQPSEEAITSYDQAIELKPDYHQAWYNRSFVISALGRHEEAITSYDQAIELKPHDHYAWYNKARCCAQWGKTEAAIESLRRAIELNPECREWTKTEADFDGIREDERFQALLEGSGSAGWFQGRERKL
ncbi:MAG: tetratricopeptide repeat protein [Leptolyngbyaceae cyanobacterium RU_5_1]|nr:tetratricopeptide repeat protein [Leptolyngbyaceae cyanobacterium RU_5_1]